MKKIYALFLAIGATSMLFAAQENIWTGTQVLGPEGNDALTLEASKFEALELNDSVAVTITDLTDSYCQLNIAGCNPWTEVPETKWSDITEAGTYRYLIGTEALLNSIKTGGMMIQGKLCTITSVDRIYDSGDDPDPEPDPEVDSVKVVWSGDTAISWNAEEYAGVQLETKNIAISFEGLQKDWYLMFRVASVEEGAQYELCKGDWSSIVGAEIAQTDTAFVFQVADEALVADIIANGMVIKGIRFHLTAIIMSATDPTVKPEPEPEPEEKEYEYRTVWTGDVAISWNQEVYMGTELITIDIQQDMFAGLQEKDSIKIYYAEAIDGAQFALSYRDEDWNYVDLTVSEKEGFFAYKVASEELAEAIADRGLVVRGQGYHATRIVVGTPKSTTGIDQIENNQSSNRKFIKDGRLFIIRNGVTYTINGQVVQ